MTELSDSFVVRPAHEVENVDTLLFVLQTAIRHPLSGKVEEDDVADVVASVRSSIDGRNERQYLMAESPAGVVLGMMGLEVPPSPGMRPYATTDMPGEVINAYVDLRQRGQGVGRALLQGIEGLAHGRGLTELVVNSGPRYMRSGWPFWRRMYGEPIAMAKDYYGPRFDAAVWRKLLTPDAA